MTDDGTVRVEPAGAEDFDELVRLFDAYRVFYECESDVSGARRFLTERVRGDSSRFFVAKLGARTIGFMHLTPALSTLAMSDTWFLEDIFVDPDARRNGAGSALLRAAEAFARNTGATRISLTTAHTNHTAQRVYIANGYEHDEVFRTYSLALD